MAIKEYWNLIESFCKMLMNHKNFHLIQVPDKTNDTIFLKSPKTLFLGQFWPFLVIFAWWGFFQKNPALSNATIYGLLTPCLVLKKTKKPIEKTYQQTERRMEGWTERWTGRPYRDLPGEARCPARAIYEWINKKLFEFLFSMFFWLSSFSV